MTKTRFIHHRKAFKVGRQFAQDKPFRDAPVDVTIVACPSCDAAIGETCVNLNGTPSKSHGNQHRARRRIAIRVLQERDEVGPGTVTDNNSDMAANGRSRNGRAAKTHCPAGHEYAGMNLYVTPQGTRQCWTCMNARRRL